MSMRFPTPSSGLTASFSVLGVGAALLLNGCDSSLPAVDKKAPPSGKRFKIGFANLTEDIPFAVRVREGVEKAAKAAGNVDLVELDNRLDGPTALSNADSFISQGVQGVIEFQTDEKYGKAIMDKMKAKSIPVIAIDIPMPGATFFGVNNPVAGKMAGVGLGQWIKKNWGGQVDELIMLELPQSGPVPAARVNGQRTGLESVIGKIPESKVTHLDSKNTLNQARRLVADALTALPIAHHVAVVCINDDTAAGAVAAAVQANRKNDIAVVAVDGSDSGRADIRKPASPHIGSTASFPELYGSKIIPALVERLDGGKLPPAFYINPVFLTKDNIDKYYPEDPK